MGHSLTGTAFRRGGEFSSAFEINAWWGLVYAKKAREHEGDAHWIAPSSSFPLGTYVVATLRQLLDGDVAPKTHCNEKGTAAERNGGP